VNLTALYAAMGIPEADHASKVEEAIAHLDALKRDAARYRAIRSEEWATEPAYYPFWHEFEVKLCRLERMDALVDKWMDGVPDDEAMKP
jgi:predicted aminopeptidase